MNLLDSVPAIRRIDTDRPDLFAVDVVGHVTPADVENFYGLLEAAYALHPRIDVLVRMVDFEDVDWAELDPATLAEGRHHAIEHVGKCASVGGPDWTSAFRGFFSPSIPVELRHFDADEEAEAWAWMGARPVSAS